MTTDFILPERLDSSAAPGLAAALRGRIGTPLVLDASRVTVIGALAFEVLIAAGRQWQADGNALTIRHPSARFAAACGTLGLPCDALWQDTKTISPEREEQDA
ncbi:MAG: STAS domain-containing protein [Paracoccaceae bacterium]